MITPNQHYAILMDAGLFELREKNFDAARSHFVHASNGNPKSAGPIVALALVKLAEGDVNAAAALLGDACRMDLNDPLPRLAAAELEALAERYRNAAVGVDKIIAGLPNDAAAILAKLQYRDCSGETGLAAAELAAWVRRNNVHGDLARAATELLRFVQRPEDATALEAQA